MDAVQQKQLTVGAFLPWIGMTLDYTEDIAALIPDDMLAWRPQDPTGRFQFSLGEIVMHIADARRMFARQLSGSDSEDGYWSDGPDAHGVWKFVDYKDKQAIMDSLATAREELNAYINAPAKSYIETTEGTRKAFEKTLQQMRDQGADTSETAARGPANIVRVMMAVVAHEAGHRAALQTLLRQHGINAAAD